MQDAMDEESGSEETSEVEEEICENEPDLFNRFTRALIPWQRSMNANKAGEIQVGHQICTFAQVIPRPGCTWQKTLGL